MGYKIALFRDDDTETPVCDFLIQQPTYPGYARAVNYLVWEVMDRDPQAEWFVFGGDDVLPDPKHPADLIAEECREYFWTQHIMAPGLRPIDLGARTFGVMQPTGDKWGDKDGPYIERVAGSAWVGREFCKRIYQGKGPLWPEYFHMFVDQELQEVATKHGVFWQRPDLIHFHQHWGRPREGERIGQADRMPGFLKEANSGTRWNQGQREFEDRKAAGFPGSL